MKKSRRIEVMISAFLLVFISSFNTSSILFAEHGRGGTIAYNRLDPETGLGEVRLANAYGRDDRAVPVNLTTTIAAVPVWSRDGKVIAVTGAANGDGEQAALEIYVFEPSGSNLRKVTHLNTSGNTLTPSFKAFSPDGQRLAFVAFEETSNRTILAVNSLDGTDELTLADTFVNGRGFPNFGLDWHPRVDLLVVPGTAVDSSRTSNLPGTALFLLRPVRDALQQGRYWQVTFPDAESDCSCVLDDVLPAFSPNGRQIAFVRWRTPVDGGETTSSIRVLDLFLNEEREVIAFSGEKVWGLSWSSDGSKLLFDRGRYFDGISNPGSLGLWTINLDGSGLRNLAMPTALSPSWNWAR